MVTPILPRLPRRSACASARTARIAALIMLTAWGTGCANSKFVLPMSSVSIEDREALLARSFMPGDRILAGFDPPATDRQWRVGDQVLYGIRLERGDRVEVRFVRLTLKTGIVEPGTKVSVRPDGAPHSMPDNGALQIRHPHRAGLEGEVPTVMPGFDTTYIFTLHSGEKRRIERCSLAVLIAVDLYDETAELLTTSFSPAREASLRQGLFEYALVQMDLHRRLGPRFPQIMDQRPAEYAEETLKFVDLIEAIYALRDTLWSCASVRPLLEAVSPMPSLLSLLWNLDLEAAVLTSPAELGPVHDAFAATLGDRQVLRLPLDVYMNKEYVMRCDLLAAEPRPPLQLCAGVVGADVTLPKDPRRRLFVRLLAARRGEEIR